MNNPIEDMRERLKENFTGVTKPLKGLGITAFRPTANDMPRMPQSSISSPKAKHDTVGRPAKKEDIYKPPELYRKKPRDIWGGWL